MRRIAGVAAALVLLLAACGSDGDDNDNGNDTDGDAAATTTTSAPLPNETIGGKVVIVRGTSIAADGLEVEMDDNYFNPTVITGTAKQAVTLQLHNDGGAAHNFSLAEQSIDVVINAGARGAINVTFPTSGDLVFFCKFHRDESGMLGALRVA